MNKKSEAGKPGCHSDLAPAMTFRFDTFQLMNETLCPWLQDFMVGHVSQGGAHSRSPGIKACSCSVTLSHR